MMSARSAALAVFSLACAAPVRAETRHDDAVWFQAVAQGTVAGDLVYFAEVQPRLAGKSTQVIARPAIGVKIAERIAIYQGYANVRSEIPGGRESRENRAFQQVNWSLGRPGSLTVLSRTRLEQRWLSSGDDTGWRLREMVRGALPVKPGSKVQWLGFVEAFVALNDTDWGARRGLDRVRVFAGVELPLSGKSTVEVGYLNQFVNAADGRDRMDHVAAVNLMLRP